MGYNSLVIASFSAKEGGGLIPVFQNNFSRYLTHAEVNTLIENLVSYKKNYSEKRIQELSKEYETEEKSFLLNCDPILEEYVKIKRSFDKRRDGFVYLIKSEYGYKIGRARNLSKRSHAIKIQLPFKSELIHSHPAKDCYKLESFFHDRYKHKRLNGEWFNLSQVEVTDFMEWEDYG